MEYNNKQRFVNKKKYNQRKMNPKNDNSFIKSMMIVKLTVC